MKSKGTAKEVFASSLIEAARRRKFLILIPTILLGTGFALYSARLPDVYRTDALMQAEPMATAHDFVDATGTSHANHVLNVDEQFHNLEQIVRSESVLSQISREFGLYPKKNGSMPDQALADMRSKVIVKMAGGDELRHNEPRFVSFRVGFEGRDRDQVVKVANRLVELFIRSASASRERRVQEVAGFIDAELQPLKKKLDAQLQKIRDYKEGVVNALPEQAATNLRLLETLQTQSMQKADAIANDEARRAAIADELNELEKHGALDTIEPRVEQSPAEKRLAELQIQFQEMQTRYSADHPELRRVKKEIADLSRNLPKSAEKPRGERSPFYARYLQLKGELESLDQRGKSYRKEQEQLAQQMQAYRSRVESAPAHESAIAELTRDYSSMQTQYQEMLEKRQSARLAESFEKMSREVVFTVVDPARTPVQPFGPQRGRIALLGLLAGLSIGAALAFFAEHLDTAFESPEDFQASSDLPVLVAVPSIGRARSIKPGRRAPLPTIDDPRSVVAEQYRVLAAKLRSGDGAGPKVLGILSSAGGEGKTLTASNLALALSASGAGRVALVDCDLRRPRVHDYLGLKTEPGHGFGELLADVSPQIGRYVKEFQGIAVIPGSAKSSDAVGLLSSRNANAIFVALRGEFDYVVLDSPPILPIADSLLIAKLCDEVIVIVRARRTPRELFEQAVANLDSVHLRGVVLNDVEYQHSRYAYAYRYYQKNYLAQR
jgi:polysaccharide chain length determinant protein (PEP-CTERM system associated)